MNDIKDEAESQLSIKRIQKLLLNKNLHFKFKGQPICISSFEQDFFGENITLHFIEDKNIQEIQEIEGQKNA